MHINVPVKEANFTLDYILWHVDADPHVLLGPNLTGTRLSGGGRAAGCLFRLWPTQRLQVAGGTYKTSEYCLWIRSIF